MKIFSSYGKLFALTALIALVVSSCSDTGTGVDDELTEDQEIAISYFKEIALGFEFGNATDVTRKWNRDVLIFTGGEKDDALLNELDEIIDELNELISRDDIELRLTADSTQSNFYIYLGPGSSFGEIFPPAANFVNSNFGLFFVNFNASDFITSARMYVDTERPAPLNQLHLLREELTQALGMAQDSPRFQDSIFQINYSGTATEYNKYDKAVIQMLYHPQMQTGLFEAEVDPVLRDIVGEVIR